VYSDGHCRDHEQVTLDPARLLQCVINTDDAPATLAELYALRAGRKATVGEPQNETGLYL
jgi:hypothetical protein